MRYNHERQQNPEREIDPRTIWRYVVEGNDWPAGRSSMSIGEVLNTLDMITPATSEAAQLSLKALSQRNTGKPPIQDAGYPVPGEDVT